MLKHFFRTSRESVFTSLTKPSIAMFSGAEGQKTSLKKYSLTAKADQNGKLHLKGKELGEVTFQNALEANLGSLLTCEHATLKFWARTKNIEITGFEVKELNGIIDTRGFGGVPGVPSRFLEVNGLIEIDGNMTDKQLQELHERVAKSCPVYDLYQAAGVKMDVKWVKKA